MAKVKIVSDSSCDLSPELVAKYDIDIIPFYINLGGKTVLDGVDIDHNGIFDFVKQNDTLPGTVAVSIEGFRRSFEKWKAQGYDVICHTISSEMSCTCQNARIAAEGLEGVTIHDSRNLSTGVGHLVVNSAILAQQGLSADEIVKVLDELTPRVRASFILDNLEYMRKGGRCSSVMLLGSNLLKIKPEIVVDNGGMRVGRKFRGSLPKVLEQYVDMRLETTASIRPDRLFITHTGCSEEIVRAVRERVEQHMHFDEILETHAGATVTSHCGPNTLGILYIEK